jgi:hypothetical protein
MQISSEEEKFISALRKIPAEAKSELLRFLILSGKDEVKARPALKLVARQDRFKSVG